MIIDEVFKAALSILALIFVGGIAIYFFLSIWSITVVIILLFSGAYWFTQKYLTKYVCESCHSSYKMKQGKLAEIEKDK